MSLRRWAALLILALGSAQAANGAPLFELRGGDYAVLYDPGQSFTAAEVSQAPLAQRFAVREVSPGFAGQASGVWLRFRLPAPAEPAAARLLSAYSAYARLCLYWPDDAGGYQADCRGATGAASDPRSYGGPGHLFEIPPGTDFERPVLVYAEASLWLNVPIVFGSVDQVLAYTAARQAGFGVYYGVFLGVLVLSLVMWLLRRDRLFLDLAGVIAAIAVFLAASENHLATWGVRGDWVIQLAVPAVLIGIAIGTDMLRLFLELKRTHPVLDRWLRRHQYAALLFLPVYLPWPQVAVIGLALILLSWPGLIVYAAWLRMREGHPSAGFTLISIGLVMLASFAGSLEVLGIPVLDPLTLTRLRYLGFLLMAGTLVVGIVDRVGRLARELDDAQRLAASARQLALHRAQYDAVTRLAKRARLREVLHEHIQANEASGHALTLSCVGIPHFRSLIRSKEQDVGDRLSALVADRLRGALPDKPVIGRIGAGEFAWLSSGDDPAQAEAECQRVREALREPLGIVGEHRLDCAFGLARYPADADNERQLVQAGEIALARALDPVSQGLEFFRKDMLSSEERTLGILAQFDEALRRDELQLHYQPLVELQTRTPNGAEALLRWPREGGGYYANAEFLPLIKRGQSLELLTRWTLRTACSQLNAWDQAGFELPYVTVNLSSHQLRMPGIADMVREAVEQIDGAGERLVIEVVEDELLEDVEAAREKLQGLRRLGVRVAVDDFGVGYSSLSYLRQLPVDILKIDRSFLNGVPDDDEALALFNGIVTLAHRLNLLIVAEGVETNAQARFLQSTGVAVGQGFLFARALPADELPGWWQGARAAA